MQERTRGSGFLAVLLVVVAGTAVIWTANTFGLWWVTVLVGAAIGLALRGTLSVLAAAWPAALAGWGLDLLWQSRQGANIGGTASVVAGIMGFGTGNGAIVLVLALVLASLLCLSGAWLTSALRQAARVLVSRPEPVAVDAVIPPAGQQPGGPGAIGSATPDVATGTESAG